MAHSIIGVSYAYLLIGDLATIQAPDAGWERVPDFADVSGGMLRIQAATHTGLDETFAVDLPEAWTEVEVRVTCPRYAEFDGEFLDEAEPIILEFGHSGMAVDRNPGLPGANRCWSAISEVSRDRRGPR